MASLTTADEVPASNWDVRSIASNAHLTLKDGVKHVHSSGKSAVTEVKAECFEILEINECIKYIKENYSSFLYCPYLPAFHRPGWLLRYAVGPHTPELLESFLNDIWAGITVALTLIPQGLSYAALANMPPICGLYTATLPAAIYTFFGSANQLTVGPVALVSLLMGSLVTQYGLEGAEASVIIDFASECALAVGTILMVMSVLNLGNFIRFISHPVMSGFTTAAAMLIGLNQLKSAFGFKSAVPQQGQEGYEYNYQVFRWFTEEWNGRDPKTGAINRNHYATQICFGLYIPLMVILLINNNLKTTPARAKSWAFKIWKMFAALSPFFAIIIGAHIAWQIKRQDHYSDTSYKHHQFYRKNLKIVGLVEPGVDFLRHASMKWDFGKLLGDVFPCALIAFMESYSVAHRIAIQKNELHMLNASQELWAIGAANMMASVCSGYPVAGSFSRTSLNAAAGARTPLSKATTMSVVLIALSALTKTFQYIPNAALAAVIFVAIFNLISFSDFWHAWKHSKKDFFVMLVTAVIVFVFDTSIGLAVGIATSFLVFVVDTAFSKANAPELLSAQKDNNGIDVIKLHGDISFLTSGRFKDFFDALILQEPPEPAADASCNEQVFHKVTKFLDWLLKPKIYNSVDILPKAIALDFTSVRIVDITGLEDVAECARAARVRGVKFVLYNVTVNDVSDSLVKYGIYNDASSVECDLEPYLKLSSLPVVDVPSVKAIESADVSEDGDNKKKNGDYEMVNVPTVSEV